MSRHQRHLDTCFLQHPWQETLRQSECKEAHPDGGNVNPPRGDRERPKGTRRQAWRPASLSDAKHGDPSAMPSVRAKLNSQDGTLPLLSTSLIANPGHPNIIFGQIQKTAMPNKNFGVHGVVPPKNDVFATCLKTELLVSRVGLHMPPTIPARALASTQGSRTEERFPGERSTACSRSCRRASLCATKVPRNH